MSTKIAKIKTAISKDLHRETFYNKNNLMMTLPLAGSVVVLEVLAVKEAVEMQMKQVVVRLHHQQTLECS